MENKTVFEKLYYPIDFPFIEIDSSITPIKKVMRYSLMTNQEI